MNAWTSLVEGVASGMTTLGDMLGGSLGLGILVMTFVVRALMIPVMLPMAVHTRDRQRVVRRIRPEIKKIHKDFRDDPGGMSRELKQLHERHGIKVVDWPGLGLAFIQLPVLIALFQAVLLVSEGTPLAQGGVLLGFAAGLVSFFGTKVSGQGDDAPWLLWMAGLLPIAIAVWLGEGIALYLLGFYGASAIQGILMRKRRVATDPPL